MIHQLSFPQKLQLYAGQIYTSMGLFRAFHLNCDVGRDKIDDFAERGG